MLEPSVLAPFVTRTFVQALLSMFAVNIAAASAMSAAEILLILYFYYY
jgi:hypothetical protein